MDHTMYEVRAWGAASRTARLVIAVVSMGLASCGSRSPLDVDPRANVAVVVDAAVPFDVGRTPQCFTDSRLIGVIPIDLYFTMDRSLSMNTIDPGSTKSRWAAVSGALNTLIFSPMSAGLGMGIGFFPRTSAQGQTLCTSADYFFPVVPIGTLDASNIVALNIQAAIGAQVLGSGTPTTPALDGAHKFARNEQMMHGDRLAAVVLVTDGAPRQCGSTVAGTAAIATEALSGSPPIKTYVLGVGPNLSNLNAIAQAGGTSEAYLVESGGQDALTTALETIRTSALTCEYVIPAEDGAARTLATAGVWTRTGTDGARLEIDQVSSAETCATGPGWFFDHPLTAGGPQPSKIVLCPASCEPVTHANNSHLDIALNCQP
jgi:hypothetical protein